MSDGAPKSSLGVLRTHASGGGGGGGGGSGGGGGVDDDDDGDGGGDGGVEDGDKAGSGDGGVKRGESKRKADNDDIGVDESVKGKNNTSRWDQPLPRPSKELPSFKRDDQPQRHVSDAGVQYGRKPKRPALGNADYKKETEKRYKIMTGHILHHKPRDQVWLQKLVATENKYAKFKICMYVCMYVCIYISTYIPWRGPRGRLAGAVVPSPGVVVI